MNYILQDTIKQLFNLVWFCRKVNIPFEVYAFTNEWNLTGGRTWNVNQQIYVSEFAEPNEHCDRVENDLYVENRFSLLNFLTECSKVKNLFVCCM